MELFSAFTRQAVYWAPNSKIYFCPLNIKWVRFFLLSKREKVSSESDKTNLVLFFRLINWFSSRIANVDHEHMKYLILIIWFQVLLFSTNNFQNRSIWARDGILTGTITSSQSGPGSNCHESVLHFEALPQVTV